ncbi:MAG: hypothetical protein ABFS41_04885 [Myxococcota bacterium]
MFEVSADAGMDPVAAVRACIERGERSLLFAEGALPDAFFDLGAHGPRFAEFAAEANRGALFRFCPDHQEARAWLAGRG